MITPEAVRTGGAKTASPASAIAISSCVCLALALWNERDPILKERLFGLSNREGNHGEDVKEYYFYLDNLPTHAYARMLYKYPQVAFPYDDLLAENARRSPVEPEYELLDAIGDAFRRQQYFDVFVQYAKHDPEDIVCQISAVNRGPEPAAIHLVPHLWYRNTWSWFRGVPRHAIFAEGNTSARTTHPDLGERWWYVEAKEGGEIELLFTENDTNARRLFGAPNGARYVKDGINDAIVLGLRDRVNHHSGSKVAAHGRATVAPGASFTVCVRLTPHRHAHPFSRCDAIVAKRSHEADAFYATVHAPHLTADERLVQRQAFAGLLWSKQFYHFDVHRWLTGDPAQPAPPQERLNGRNHEWALHFRHAGIVLMPDTWEYPWFASWDLAFHVVVMAAIDPGFAKQQILQLLHPRSQHPYGCVPAFEWDFNAANPPVLAWAAWHVYHLDRVVHSGHGDRQFLAVAFDALVLMLGWWVNRKDSDGRGIFGGGFLGLDNIGIFERDRPLPTGGELEQSDGTGWMAMFQLNMAAIALELARQDDRYVPFVHRFGQHFAIVAHVLQSSGAGGMGLWDEEDQFYFDVIRHGDERLPLKVYSMVGLVPLFAVTVVDSATLDELPAVTETIQLVLDARADLRRMVPGWIEPGTAGTRLLSVVDRDRLAAVLRRVLDEAEFLSEYGVRSLSRRHHDEPYVFGVSGREYEVRYLPGVSDNRIFGGNSNWRGPIWFPMNFLLIQAVARFARYYDDTFTLEFPTGSNRQLTLGDIAEELAQRLTRIFVRTDSCEGKSGRRAVFGDTEPFQNDSHWRDYVPFHEFFHAETGAGLGASHQTGWTSLVALLLQYGGKLCFDHSQPAAQVRQVPS